MSAPRFAPAPWSVGAHREIRCSKGTFLESPWSGVLGIREADATAQLISAAPDGYAVSKKLIEVFGYGSEREIRRALEDPLALEHLMEIVSMARKHIAKAEGR
jgi:hypothetical protein